jgi:predicted metal-dependent hydrolase
MDSVQRLLDCGLLLPDDIGNAYMSWTVRDTTRRLGFCSTMFRVVGISSVLDSPDVDDDMRDYVVYHECLHLRQRYSGDSRHHDSRFRSWERAYPGWKGIETRLGRLHQLRTGRRRSPGA